MLDIDNELQPAVDPPDDDGGAGAQAAVPAEAVAAGLDAPQTVDPPDDDGGAAN